MAYQINHVYSIWWSNDCFINVSDSDNNINNNNKNSNSNKKSDKWNIQSWNTIEFGKFVHRIIIINYKIKMNFMFLCEMKGSFDWSNNNNNSSIRRDAFTRPFGLLLIIKQRKLARCIVCWEQGTTIQPTTSICQRDSPRFVDVGLSAHPPTHTLTPTHTHTKYFDFHWPFDRFG